MGEAVKVAGLGRWRWQKFRQKFRLSLQARDARLRRRAVHDFALEQGQPASFAGGQHFHGFGPGPQARQGGQPRLKPRGPRAYPRQLPGQIPGLMLTLV